MGKATGKTFAEWLDKLNTFWAFVNQDRITVTGRNDADDGTNAGFTKRNGSVLEFTIPDAVHGFDQPTGVNDFRRYALLVGAFLAQGGVIEDVTDPFHEDEDE